MLAKAAKIDDTFYINAFAATNKFFRVEAPKANLHWGLSVGDAFQ